MGALSGCGAAVEFGRGTTETETTAEETSARATATTGRTVTIGPASPGCPSHGDDGKHWGLMERTEEKYDQSVDSVEAARRVAAGPDYEDYNPEFEIVAPRPARIEWKGSVTNVTERYETTNWYLFLPKKRGEEVGALVVGKPSMTIVVRYFVGEC